MSDHPSPTYLTSENAAKLKAELEQLKGPARVKIDLRLRSAIRKGDLSDNFDYQMAKEDQWILEGRIKELENILKNAAIIEERDVSPCEVAVGVRVTLQENGEEPEMYHLVEAKEADTRMGKISNESPIGSVLMGHRVGEELIAETPSGRRRIKILQIEPSNPPVDKEPDGTNLQPDIELGKTSVDKNVILDIEKQLTAKEKDFEAHLSGVC